jgi:hypothetical protein
MYSRDELRALIQNKSYDVIALTEILPKNKDQFDFSSVEWKMDGYDMFISPPNVIFVLLFSQSISLKLKSPTYNR